MVWVSKVRSVGTSRVLGKIDFWGWAGGEDHGLSEAVSGGWAQRRVARGQGGRRGRGKGLKRTASC